MCVPAYSDRGEEPGEEPAGEAVQRVGAAGRAGQTQTQIEPVISFIFFLLASPPLHPVIHLYFFHTFPEQS